MLVSNGTLLHRYDEARVPGRPRLGRHLELDSRSLQYTVPPEARAPIKPAEHVCPLPILDQGQLGSCTGNAGTEALAALYAAQGVVWRGLSLAGQHSLDDDAGHDEGFAVELYHEATVNDGFPGTYPPDDTGSSGLGVCRSLKIAKLISRYTWATSLHAMGTAFQRGGLMIGMPWLNAFFEPDANGFIDANPSWQSSGVAGGHEVYLEALEAWDDHDPSKVVIRFRQSWGASWGDHGYGRFHGTVYEALKQQVDLKQLVR